METLKRYKGKFSPVKSPNAASELSRIQDLIAQAIQRTDDQGSAAVTFINNYVPHVAQNYDDLRAFSGGTGGSGRPGVVYCLGRSVAADGGEGLFAWIGGTADDDGIYLNGWRRVVLNNEYDPRWFGAKCDGVSDDTAAYEAARDYAQDNGGTLVIPPGFSRLTRRLRVSKQCIVRGHGAASRSFGNRYGEATAVSTDYVNGSVIYGDHDDDAIIEVHSTTFVLTGVLLKDFGILGKVTQKKTTLNGDQLSSAATVTVVDTSGMPSSGLFVCGGAEIEYTGKTATTLTGCAQIGPKIAGSPLALTMPSGAAVVVPRETYAKTTLSVDHVMVSGVTTITVGSTVGFPDRATLDIGGYAFSYTSKTDTQFAGVLDTWGIASEPFHTGGVTLVAGTAVRMWTPGQVAVSYGVPGLNLQSDNLTTDNVYAVNCYKGFANCALEEAHYKNVFAIGCHYGVTMEANKQGTLANFDLTFDHFRPSACDWGWWDKGQTRNLTVINTFWQQCIGGFTFAGIQLHPGMGFRAESGKYKFVAQWFESWATNDDAANPEKWEIRLDCTYGTVENIKWDTTHSQGSVGANRNGRSLQWGGTYGGTITFEDGDLHQVVTKSDDLFAVIFLGAVPDAHADFSSTEASRALILCPTQERLTSAAFGKQAGWHPRWEAYSHYSGTVDVPALAIGDSVWITDANYMHTVAGDVGSLIVGDLGGAYAGCVIQFRFTGAKTFGILIENTSGLPIAAQTGVSWYCDVIKHDRGVHSYLINQAVTTSVALSSAIGAVQNNGYGSLGVELKFKPSSASTAYAAGTKLWYVDASNYAELVPASGKITVVVGGTSTTTSIGMPFAAGDIVELWTETGAGSFTGRQLSVKGRVNSGAVTTLHYGGFLNPMTNVGTLYFLQNNSGGSALATTTFYLARTYRGGARPAWAEWT